MRPETGRPLRISDHLQRHLDQLRHEARFRTLEAGPWDFCSNDYLGLARDAVFSRRVSEAIQRSVRTEGAASTGSRLLSGHGSHWDDLEEAFARFVGTESGLYFGSGYLANVGLLSALAGREDTYFSDAANHASLIDGIRLSRARKVVFPHCDLDFLEDGLRNAPGTGARIIVTESVFSMEGDRAPIGELTSLAERYGAALIVDEAHATGVFGPGGRGIVEPEMRDPGPVVATISTCGKALAAPGAFVAGSRLLRDFLVNTARPFIFSTALPPYAAAHVTTSLDVAQVADPARERLASLSADIRRRLSDIGASTGAGDTHIVPVLLGTNQRATRVAERLRSRGIHVRPIRPPTVPEATARLRLSITADIAEAKVDAMVRALADALREEE